MKIVIVLDCGATNIRAIAVNPNGQVIAKAQEPNMTLTGYENDNWHIWPIDAIFEKFSRCTQKLLAQLPSRQIEALTVTSFGVDGTLVDHNGTPLYPVISWKCPRTAVSQKNLANYIAMDSIVMESGVGHYSFNTVNKLVWFKENCPELLERAYAWLFISSLLNHRLTGKLTTDATMAGTSQLTQLNSQTFSANILKALDLEESLFPPLVTAGSYIGPLQPEAAQKLGLPKAIPVISSGHDTQCALFGSGAVEGQPVLSSGTWEVLMARVKQVRGLTPTLFDHGFTCEWDAERGLYNPGSQWLASGTLECLSQIFYPEAKSDRKYEQMIQEAALIEPGCHGITVNTDFLTDQNGNRPGAIEGLTLSATPAMIYRATLEALALKLKTHLHQLKEISHLDNRELILVGGGSRNSLWNQIKANTLQIPIKIPHEAETTALGAAMFAMAGIGLYDSPNAAQTAFDLQYKAIYPE